MWVSVGGWWVVGEGCAGFRRCLAPGCGGERLMYRGSVVVEGRLNSQSLLSVVSVVVRNDERSGCGRLVEEWTLMSVEEMLLAQ